MGGILAPSTTIGGSVLAPGIPLFGAPLSGLYELPALNGAGFAVNQLNYFTLTALGVTFGNTPSAAFTLAATAGYPFATIATPNGVDFSPNGAFVAVCSYSGTALSVYTFNSSTGALTLTAGSPYVGGNFQYDTKFSPDGLRLAVSCQNDNQVRIYSVNQTTGALTAVAGSPFATGAGPNEIAYSTLGAFFAVANYTANTVSMFTVDVTTGVLTPVAGSPFACGALPRGISFSPNDNFLAVTSAAGNNVSIFQVAPLTGVLTAVAGSPFATGNSPYGVTFSPNGSYMAVANRVAVSTVSVYSFNSATGYPTPVTGSPFAAGNFPTYLRYTADSNNLVVTNEADSTVSAYSVGSNGALTAVAGSPFAAGVRAVRPVFSPDGRHLLLGADVGANLAMFNTAAVPTYNLIYGAFDSTGGLGGSVYINGNLYINGNTPATYPAVAGNDGKFLQLGAGGVPAWTPLNKYIPVAMVANAGAFTVDTNSEYIVDVTGVLTGTGTITYTATIVPLPTTVIFNNMTTGGYPLILNAGGFVIPPGKSTWYWDGATLKIVTQNTVRAQSLAMVANAGALTLYDHCNNYVDVTGVLTANGQITTTFPTNATQVTFDNATTGLFLLQINAGTYTIPRGMSIWTWNGAAFELVTPINGACFEAYLPTADQALVSGATPKIVLSAKSFDLTNAFDAVTNNRFQPTVEGYYSISWGIYFTAATNMTSAQSLLSKNGASVKVGDTFILAATAVVTTMVSNGSAIVYMNGTTDYLELIAYCVGTGALAAKFGANNTYLCGSFLRCAR